MCSRLTSVRSRCETSASGGPLVPEIACGKMKCIRRATRADAAEIYSLRLSEYMRAEEFRLAEPTILLWNERDDRDGVLTAWDKSNDPISTMRGGIARTKQEAEERIKCTLPNEYAFPALLLDRGATKEEHRGRALNSALRYYFFLASLNLPISSVLGAVYEKAPRVNTMMSLGYTLFAPARNRQTHLLADRPLLITYLQGSKIQDACDRLKTLAHSALDDYPWQGDPLQFNL